MTNMLVPILLGGESDREWAKKITDELDTWGIPHKVQVCSAHKVPEMLIDIIREYNQFDGLLCYVTIAGRSNGLSGCTAGSAIHPVIACPPFKDKADMMVNLNSTIQMPSETPVLTVLDPNNVANCIARIFGLANKNMQEKCATHVRDVKAKYVRA